MWPFLWICDKYCVSLHAEDDTYNVTKQTMKRLMILSGLTVALAAAAQDMKLPAPNMERASKSVMETFALRHSTREYAERPLTEQDMADLCWAACGRTRDDKHITAPSAMNRQEIRLFVLNSTGAYEYLAATHSLKLCAEGDHRGLLATNDTQGKGFSQDFVKQAPVCLVMVIDLDKFGSSSDNALMMGCVDAGNVSENINLFCEAAGLCTVPRATMDVKALRQVLGLTERQVPIMNNPVGYPKTVQAPLERVYDEQIDAMQQVEDAAAEARRTGRNVICQVGGNWCKWCLRFADFVKNDTEIAQCLADNYVYRHVNYPRQNPGPLLKRLGNPGRFGYPVLVVINGEGEVIHTQDTSLLEKGDSYDRKKVLRFLNCWKADATQH